MLIVRSLFFHIAFYLAISALMIFGLPSLLMGRIAAQFMAKTWARVSIWLMAAICGLKVEFRGLENIPKGALLIAAKHQSTLETFAMTLAFDDFSYILKRELTWLPLFGWYLAGAGQVAINRSRGGSALNQAAERAAEAFAQGRQIFIFPEGTRRPVGAPPVYKYGATHIYAASKTPCLPVAMNTGLFWPRRSFLIRPGVAVIEYLPVLPPGLGREAFARTLQAAVEGQSNRLMQEALRKDPELARIYGPLLAQAGA